VAAEVQQDTRTSAARRRRDRGRRCASPSPVGVINHALLWQNGSPINLGNLGGNLNNLAWDINNRSQVVGWSDLPHDRTFHAFLWQKGVMTDLGTLPGDAYSLAYSINDSGQVVGQSCDATGNCRAFLWENGTMTDLNTLAASSGTFDLLQAQSINSQGEIVGVALDQINGDPLFGDAVAFSAIPCDGSYADHQGCTRSARNAVGINAPTALSRELGPHPDHRLTGLGVLDGLP
jgi:probable HAF family extracellular repeat protein